VRDGPASTVASFIILLILFVGGGFAGEQLAIALAQGSGLSRLLGFLALPASFVFGFFAWAGAAAIVVVKWFAKGGARSSQRPRGIPPGASGFLWSSVLSCSLVGMLIGLLSNTHGFIVVFSSYFAVGVAYGALCWRLARSGWLQFPRE
jgi:hypothetical protein